MPVGTSDFEFYNLSNIIRGNSPANVAYANLLSQFVEEGWKVYSYWVPFFTPGQVEIYNPNNLMLSPVFIKESAQFPAVITSPMPFNSSLSFTFYSSSFLPSYLGVLTLYGDTNNIDKSNTIYLNLGDGSNYYNQFAVGHDGSGVYYINENNVKVYLASSVYSFEPIGSIRSLFLSINTKNFTYDKASFRGRFYNFPSVIPRLVNLGNNYIFSVVIGFKQILTDNSRALIAGYFILYK